MIDTPATWGVAVIDLGPDVAEDGQP